LLALGPLIEKSIVNIRIHDIDVDGLDVEFNEDESWGEFLPPHGPVFAALRIERSHEYIRVRGTVSVVVKQECSRCLEEFNWPVEAAIESILIPRSALGDEESRELTGEDLDLRTYEGEEFSVDEIVAEQIVLSLPVKPLCAEGCKGLCPSCGVNKNRETCACESPRDDHPFAALKNLKLK